MMVFNPVNKMPPITLVQFPIMPLIALIMNFSLPGMIIAYFLIKSFIKQILPSSGRKMTTSIKVITIVVFLALLLGTGSALAFLVPLPVAHGLTLWASK
jgi:hypothetical protein